MSFLNQLKNQAKTLQSQQSQAQQQTQENIDRTEKACDLTHYYLEEAGRGLSVIQPPGPPMTLDGKTPWPAMKLVDFRIDSRRKQVGKQQLYDTISLGWDIVPQIGAPVGGVVSANFPTDLQRIEARLAMGPVKHERKEERHPESRKLLAYRYEYMTQTRGGVIATADHEKGLMHFRLMNTLGFEIVEVTWPSARINHDTLDELAKRIAGQPSRFA
jgi:hypothetical protein